MSRGINVQADYALVEHVGRGYAGWFSYNLQHPVGLGDPMAAMQSAPPVPESFDARLEYLRDSAESYCSLARSLDLNEPVWAFWSSQPARFWALRAATEYAIHNWDAQSAVGTPDALDPAEATTSLEETIVGFWPAVVARSERGFLVSKPVELPETPIGIAATDTGRSWRVTSSGGVLSVAADSELPETTVSGAAHDLALYHWGRAPSGPIQIEGSPTTADSWNLVQRAFA